MLIAFSPLLADIDFDVSDLFSLNTAFDEHRYLAISDLFSVNTAFDEHRYSAISSLFSLNTAFDEHYYSYISDLFDLNTAFQPDDRIVVAFAEGWNMISINVSPPEELWEREEGPNVIRMMEQLRLDEDNHHVLLMKDQDGQFYYPALGFNNIPYWDLAKGYQVKIDDENLETTWFGDPIPADSDVPLTENWNITAYFPTYELNASAPDFYVLSPIMDHVLVAKNNDGEFINPEFNFSNMPPWRESQGYMVKVDEGVVLNYPVEEVELCALGMDLSLRVTKRQSNLCDSERERLLRYARNDRQDHTPAHWSKPVHTNANMSVLITAIKSNSITDGDQVAAFASDGRLVGLGTVKDGRCGIAVWGDDASTESIDGLQKGEDFELRYWDSKRKFELDLTVVAVHDGSGLVYETDAFTALDMAAATAIPDDFFLAAAYPNPFNSVIRLSYGLPQAARVTIQVYDIAGRLVTTLTDNEQPAGYHNALWNGSGISSGSYFVKMESVNFSAVRKVALVK